MSYDGMQESGVEYKTKVQMKSTYLKVVDVLGVSLTAGING
jgi:hypothetical protein